MSESPKHGPTVVMLYDLHTEYSSVDGCIRRIGSTMDTLEFHTLLHQAYFLLDFLKLAVKSKRDPFGKILPTAILGLTFEFLTSKETLTVERTCKTWHDTLISASNVWKLLIHRHDFHFLTPSLETSTSLSLRNRVKQVLELEHKWKYFLKKDRTFYPRSKVLTIDVSEKKNELLTGGGGGVASLWHLKAGSRVNRYFYPEGHDITAAKIGDNCIFVAGNTSIHRFMKQDPAISCRVGTHQGLVNSLGFHGENLISGSGDCTIKLWDIDRCEVVRSWEEHKQGVNAIHPCRTDCFISSSSDCSIKLWDPRTKECLRTMSGHKDAVNCLSCDENTLASGSLDGIVYLWDMKMIKMSKYLCSNIRPFCGIYIRGHRVVTGTQSDIRVWNEVTQLCSKRLPSSDSMRAFFCTPQLCFTGGDRGELYLFDFTVPLKKQEFPDKGCKSEEKINPLLESVNKLDLEVANKPFYQGNCGRGIAELLLDAGPWGAFLVRDCSDRNDFVQGAPDPNLFVLSVKLKKSISHHKMYRYSSFADGYPAGFGFHYTRSLCEKIYPSVWALVYDTIGTDAVSAT